MITHLKRSRSLLVLILTYSGVPEFTRLVQSQNNLDYNPSTTVDFALDIQKRNPKIDDLLYGFSGQHVLYF